MTVHCEVCHSDQSDILNHLRLFHPDHYGDGPDPDVVDTTGADLGAMIARLMGTPRLADRPLGLVVTPEIAEAAAAFGVVNDGEEEL